MSVLLSLSPTLSDHMVIICPEGPLNSSIFCCGAVMIIIIIIPKSETIIDKLGLRVKTNFTQINYIIRWLIK